MKDTERDRYPNQQVQATLYSASDLRRAQEDDEMAETPTQAAPTSGTAMPGWPIEQLKILHEQRATLDKTLLHTPFGLAAGMALVVSASKMMTEVFGPLVMGLLLLMISVFYFYAARFMARLHCRRLCREDRIRELEFELVRLGCETAKLSTVFANSEVTALASENRGKKWFYRLSGIHTTDLGVRLMLAVAAASLVCSVFFLSTWIGTLLAR
ncbi:MAG: hypothetical protein K9N51_09195 [Candidatus Pacebacteria bacterium]|nr:hypothetical protein [Candidatus Paceibacterota bacterium]